MLARVTITALSALAVLSACGEPAPDDAVDTSEDQSLDAANAVAPEPQLPPVEPIEFSGVDQRVVTFDEPLTTYRLVAEFVTDVRVEDEPYSNTFPPMPLLADVITVSQRESSFLIQTRGAAGDQTMSGCGFASPCRVVIESNSDGASIQVRSSEPLVFDEPLALERVVLGRGFQDRFWTGTFTQLTICDPSGVERAFGQHAACVEE